MRVPEARPGGRPRATRTTTLLVLAGLQAVTGCVTWGARPSTASLPVDGGTIEYEVRGRGPAVVLLHGGLVDRRVWDRQVDALADDFRVIRYDLRGLGRSSVPDRPFSHLDDLHRLLDALSVEEAVLVGLSLGGMIALDYSLEHPDRVRGLVLAAPGLRGYDWSPNPALEEAFRTVAADPGRGVTMLLDTGMGGVSGEAREALDRMVRENVSGWSRVDPDIVRWPSPPTLERLGQVRVPTLVLIGSEDEPDLRTIAGLLGREIPGASRVVLDRAGHHLNLDRPREFNRALIDFLRRQ